MGKDLGLAHTLEQRGELGGGLLGRRLAQRGHQVVPGGLEPAAALRCLGHGDAELLQQGFVRGRQPELGEQTIQLGARDLLAAVGVAEDDGLGVHGVPRDR